MRIRNTFWSMLVQDVEPARDVVIESIRHAMLSALDDLQKSDVRELDHKISYISDITDLWNIRPELQSAISAELGEEVAMQRLDTITELFRNY